MPEASNSDARISIQDALVELLESKPLDRISVSDISKAANVSRGTFYYHFQDKYEVANSLLQRPMQFAELDEMSSLRTWSDIISWLDAYLQSVQENQSVYRALFKLNLLDQLTDAFNERCLDTFMTILSSKPAVVYDQDYLLRCVQIAIREAIMMWVIGHCERPREEVLRDYVRLLGPLRFFVDEEGRTAVSARVNQN